MINGENLHRMRERPGGRERGEKDKRLLGRDDRNRGKAQGVGQDVGAVHPETSRGCPACS